jgi:hypothetical protein
MGACVITTISHPLKDELRADLLPLAEFCPVDESNSEDCPLHSVRKMKAQQRLQWFNALDEDELVYLATYHHICLNTKTAFKPDEKLSPMKNFG